MQAEVGSILDGKVTGITNFGAFVELEDGSTGLVHISEVALEYVKDIKDHIKVNDTVKVKVLSIEGKGKVALSIKQALKDTLPQERGGKAKKAREKNLKNTESRSNPGDFDWFATKANDNLSFEDKLSRFKQASDEKMHDLKKSVESKRGSSRRSTNYF